MPKSSPIQTNFNGGQFAPLVQGRTDSERYKSGLDKLYNYIPTKQGSIVRRPGNKYCSTAKDSANGPRLIPFEFSVTQAYILEFGDKYIRFYANNGQVVTTRSLFQVQGATTPDQTFNGFGTNIFSFYSIRLSITPNLSEVVTTSSSITIGSVMELVTPFAIADVPLLKFTQSADTLYIVHPNYPPYKLQRFDQDLWTLQQIILTDGPYLENNSHDTTSDSLAVKLIPSGTSGGMTIETGPLITISGCANNGSGLIRVTATSHGYVTGQKICIIQVVGTTEANTGNFGSANNFWTITVITANTFDLQGSAFVHSYVSGGIALPYLFVPTDVGRSVRLQTGTQWGYGWIYAVIRGYDALVVVPGTGFADTTAKSVWKLGAYSSVNGYPGCVCFFQDRLSFSGVPSFPQRVDLSVSADYENFLPSSLTDSSVADDNAISENLNSNQVNAIRWLSSDEKGLLAGALTSEWTLRPNSTSEALTPTNFNASQSSFYGSANIQPVHSGKATIYIQRSQRKIREMYYYFQVDGFRATDLTEISDILTIPTITQLAAQTETQPVVWAVRSDGALVSTSYQRDDLTLISGCAWHELGGQSDAGGTRPIVTSIAVIPSIDQTFDQLWMTVQRWINGAKVVTIEYMTKIFDDSFDQSDSYHWDCGATFDNPKTITGISTASQAVITSNAHGFSNGDQVKLSGVIGVSTSATDSFGTKTITSLLNSNTFVVSDVTTNTFKIKDFSGNYISSSAFSAYVSGGQARKLVTTISGLTWLENETVNVLVDGAEHPPIVVSNSGVITLQYAGTKIQVGYGYNSDGKQLRLESGSATGSSMGKTKRSHRFSMLVHQTGSISIGMSFDELFPFISRQGDVEQLDQAVPLYSGYISETLAANYDFEDQLCWRQNGGLPGMISSITRMMEEFDR